MTGPHRLTREGEGKGKCEGNIVHLVFRRRDERELGCTGHHALHSAFEPTELVVRDHEQEDEGDENDAALKAIRVRDGAHAAQVLIDEHHNREHSRRCDGVKCVVREAADGGAHGSKLGKGVDRGRDEGRHGDGHGQGLVAIAEADVVCRRQEPVLERERLDGRAEQHEADLHRRCAGDPEQRTVAELRGSRRYNE